MNISPSVRHGSALVGIAGALLLSGCAASPAVSDAEGTGGASGSGATTSPSASSGTESSGTGSSGSSSTGAYKDGKYTADGSYRTPETVEKISVTVTLAGGVIEDVSVTGDPQAPETTRYQGEFIGGIAEVVTGKSLDDISVSKVAGSSLTSQGFNQAIEKIREQAAS
ncbi:uncharacterized protein with FMN-binding domain [Microbacterium resistens]|uniref:Uncharacterized protein with FMN-binding domain n=1 Tax=Microbacterium resistens TaxID=156977 RepID=A0ABU1S7T6_9MICO|nr:hypothetical protein [Microbacterium resistens]MDR6865678.1 uncharacterized protein with FMN-binding domain [Microbacterium resistens]